jgi:uncharacterized protein with HEPN domain
MRKADLRLEDYLTHMIQAIERINAYVAGIQKDAWLSNSLVQDAVIRNIEILGEAAHNVQTHDPEFAQKNPHMPWDDAYWMRNVLSHGYFHVDLDIVWTTIQSELPIFLESLHLLRANFQNN